MKEVATEGVNSFAIEGEALDPLHMTQSLIASLRSRDRTAAAGTYPDVAAVMLDARDISQPMTLTRLNEWHARLFRRDRFLKDIGRLRSTEMRVVTMGQFEVREVHFEAPPPGRPAADMQSRVDWIAKTGPDGEQSRLLATPGRAALAHLLFETIHPYSDGNGRIGRALADFVVAQNPIFLEAPFSLSRAIQENKNEYYEALARAQAKSVDRAEKVDVKPFVCRFAGAMRRAIKLASRDASYIHLRNRFFERHAASLNNRQEKALRRIFEEGPKRLTQGLSSKPYQRITGVSSATATRDLSDLVKKETLNPTRQGGRATGYLVNLGEVQRPDQRTL